MFKLPINKLFLALIEVLSVESKTLTELKENLQTLRIKEKKTRLYHSYRVSAIICRVLKQDVLRAVFLRYCFLH